jgi:Tfp pilus assembly protein PilZ
MQALIVYLASRTEQENQILCKKLEPLHDEFPGVRYVGLHPQGIAMAARDRIDTLVLNIAELNPLEIERVRDARRSGYTGPILVAAKPGRGAELSELQAMRGVVFLEKPFETKDLLGILSKMLTARMVAQRVHRRFNTDQMGALEFYGRTEQIKSKVCNISKGGAYLELMTPAPLRAGDIVRLTVELNDLNRCYVVSARVVWTKNLNQKDSPGVGVEFVGTPDLKRPMSGGL